MLLLYWNATSLPLSSDNVPIDNDSRIINITGNVQAINQTVGASLKVGDNTAPFPSTASTAFTPSPDKPTMLGHCHEVFNSDTDDPFSSNPDDPWHSTFSELRSMRSRMLTLEQLDHNARSLSKTVQDTKEKNSSMDIKINKNLHQIQAIDDKTSTIKAVSDPNSQQIQQLTNEVSALKKVIEDQRQTISDLTNIRNDFKKDKEEFSKKSRSAVEEMNKLVNAQREQVESFRTIRDEVKQKSEVQGRQLTQISQEMDHHKLKYQAYRQHLN